MHAGSSAFFAGLIVTAGAFAQAPALRPAFEAASIKPDDDPARAGILRPSPGALTSENMSVRTYIGLAWHVKDYQLFIPAALKKYADSRYAIVAKADHPAPRDEVMQMLQTLLIERFHLVVHSEKRDLPVFALTAAKDRPKQLRTPAPDSDPGMDLDATKTDGGQHWLFHNQPVSALMGLLSNGLSRPIIDATGIQGSFDFTFILPPWDRANGTLADHLVDEVFPEVQRQLGLRLEPRTAPIDVLVIDHLDAAPSEN